MEEDRPDGDERVRRRKTLESLLELSEPRAGSSCFGPGHAEALLRRQSTPEELIEMGVSRERVDQIFRHDREPHE